MSVLVVRLRVYSLHKYIVMRIQLSSATLICYLLAPTRISAELLDFNNAGYAFPYHFSTTTHSSFWSETTQLLNVVLASVNTRSYLVKGILVASFLHRTLKPSFSMGFPSTNKIITLFSSPIWA